MTKENIAYTIECEERPSLIDWMAEFRIGLMAPKHPEGKQKAKEMMKLWEDRYGRVDFSQIKLLRIED